VPSCLLGVFSPPPHSPTLSPFPRNFLLFSLSAIEVWIQSPILSFLLTDLFQEFFVLQPLVYRLSLSGDNLLLFNRFDFLKLCSILLFFFFGCSGIEKVVRYSSRSPFPFPKSPPEKPSLSPIPPMSSVFPLSISLPFEMKILFVKLLASDSPVHPPPQINKSPFTSPFFQRPNDLISCLT